MNRPAGLKHIHTKNKTDSKMQHAECVFIFYVYEKVQVWTSC